MSVAKQMRRLLPNAARNRGSVRSCANHLKVRPSGRIVAPQDEEKAYKTVATIGSARIKATTPITALW